MKIVIGNKYLLPIEYQEVEYIETDGNQYLDSGICVDSENIEVGITYMDTLTSSTSRSLFGSSNSNKNWLVPYKISDNSSIGLYLGISGNFLSVQTNLGEKNTYIVKVNTTTKDVVVELNGTEYTKSGYSSTIYDATSIGIFCQKQGSTTYIQKFIGRLYSFHIKKDGVLVQNLRPCYRVSDGVIGMFDTVTKTFFTNLGTVNFIKGPIVNEDRYYKSAHNIPKGYRQLEFIKSTGTQWIDTGVVIDKAVKITVDFLVTNYSRSCRICGAGSCGQLWWSNDNYFHSYTNTDTNTTLSAADNNRHTYIYDGINLVCKLDDTSVSMTSFSGSDNVGYSLFWSNGSSYYKSKAKIYRCTIESTSGIEHDLIPAVRLSDSEYGFYDLITGDFCTNSGTGSFTGGEVVTENSRPVLSKLFKYCFVNSNRLLPLEYQELEYITGTGTQYLSIPGINTSNMSSVNMILTADLTADSTSSTTQSTLFGFSGLSFQYYTRPADNNYYKFWYTSGGTSTSEYLIGGNKKLVHKFSFNSSNVVFNINGVTFATRNELNKSTISSKDISIGAYGGGYHISCFNLYGFKVDGLIDLIPCYRKSDNVVGVYDLIRGTFHTNVGTDNFVKGPKVNPVKRFNTLFYKYTVNWNQLVYDYVVNINATETTNANGETVITCTDVSNTTRRGIYLQTEPDSTTTSFLANTVYFYYARGSVTKPGSVVPRDYFRVPKGLYEDGSGIWGSTYFSTGTNTVTNTTTLLTTFDYAGSISNNNIGIIFAEVGDTFTFAEECPFQLLNLTQMFGAGNEPTNNSDFISWLKENNLYKFNPYCTGKIIETTKPNWIN